ncbi:cytochrome oxidase c subunit VIb-domain-containing protein [Mycena olivaceomarginata]|nr:cytochrome oxidase c subunit VIb-domain-containing protein [Mycena olivaceomarginata]
MGCGHSVTHLPQIPVSPTRQERQKCWESRDAYFACLDGVGVVNAGTEGKVCAAENRVYEKSCAQSWVTYFNERRKLAFPTKGYDCPGKRNRTLPRNG